MSKADETVTISIGGQDFTVKCLTFGQLEELSVEIDAVTSDMTEVNPMTGASSVKPQLLNSRVASACKILSIAFSEDYPEIAKDNCKSLRGTIVELFRASDEIMILSGYVKRDSASGEAQAVAEKPITDVSAHG